MTSLDPSKVFALCCLHHTHETQFTILPTRDMCLCVMLCLYASHPQRPPHHIRGNSRHNHAVITHTYCSRCKFPHNTCMWFIKLALFPSLCALVACGVGFVLTGTSRRTWHGPIRSAIGFGVRRSGYNFDDEKKTRRRKPAFLRCNSDDSTQILRFDDTILTIKKQNARKTYVCESICQRHLVFVSQTNTPKKEINV